MFGESNVFGKGLFFFLGAVFVLILFVFYARVENNAGAVDLNFQQKIDLPSDSNWNLFPQSGSNNSSLGSPVDSVEVFFCPKDLCAEKLIKKN